MLPITIDVYLDQNGEHFSVALASAGYNKKWTEQAEQCERFVSTPYLAYVCVWNGRLTRVECQTFVTAWLGNSFTSIDLNK